MRNQVFNPYLPGWEYIPDGEPHVFGERLYLYGSHDRAQGTHYCQNDYVCWSASLDDLSAWRYEGFIYHREQHPARAGEGNLFAPDVVQGPDGRFYMYYNVDKSTYVSVAVADAPTGPFVYLGDVSMPDGHAYGTREDEWFCFDPSVLVDTDGRIWLYAGSGQRSNAQYGRAVVGCFAMELEPDMHTVRTAPRIVLPEDEGLSKPSFFEGASARHIGDRYYLVYPTTNLAGLGYAMSDRPDGGFVYQGPIHSSSDVGLDGQPLKRAHYPIGNSHGGLVCVRGQWYVFDHRMTNGTFFSRQGVAEPVTIAADGSIAMVEATSCGLNGGPLAGRGSYPAYIACNLWGPGEINKRTMFEGARIAQDEPDFDPVPGQVYSSDDASGPRPYLENLTDGWTVGYKYFSFAQPTTLTLRVRGTCEGTIELSCDDTFAQQLTTVPCKLDATEWTELELPCALAGERVPLYLRYHGAGALQLREITFVPGHI